MLFNNTKIVHPVDATWTIATVRLKTYVIFLTLSVSVLSPFYTPFALPMIVRSPTYTLQSETGERKILMTRNVSVKLWKGWKSRKVEETMKENDISEMSYSSTLTIQCIKSSHSISFMFDWLLWGRVMHASRALWTKNNETSEGKRLEEFSCRSFYLISSLS